MCKIIKFIRGLRLMFQLRHLMQVALLNFMQKTWAAQLSSQEFSNALLRRLLSSRALSVSWTITLLQWILEETPRSNYKQAPVDSCPRNSFLPTLLCKVHTTTTSFLPAIPLRNSIHPRMPWLANENSSRLTSVRQANHGAHKEPITLSFW